MFLWYLLRISTPFGNESHALSVCYRREVSLRWEQSLELGMYFQCRELILMPVLLAQNCSAEPRHLD